MTTLQEGRCTMLEAYTDPVDHSIKGKMADQVLAMTTGSNPYFVWEHLPPEERQCFGSVEHHPCGMELCIERWFMTKAVIAWGEAYKQCK